MHTNTICDMYRSYFKVELTVSQPGCTLLLETGCLDDVQSDAVALSRDSSSKSLPVSSTVELFSSRVGWSVTTEAGWSVTTEVEVSWCTLPRDFDELCTSRSKCFLWRTATKNPPVFCLCGNMRMLTIKYRWRSVWTCTIRAFLFLQYGVSVLKGE